MNNEVVVLNLISIVLFIVAIKFIYYPIIVSAFRDTLFDMRLKLRNYFFDNELDMDMPIYRNTYDYINNTIRYIENYSFLNFIFQIHLLNKHPHIIEEYKKDIENSMDELSEEHRAFIKDIRSIVAIQFISHVIRTSFIAIFLSFILIIYNAINSLFAKEKKLTVSSEELGYIGAHC